MPRRNKFIGFAAAWLLALGAPALATDDLPPPAPDSPDEPRYGDYDPGHEAGERLTALLTGGGEKPTDGRLPSLKTGIIGVTGGPDVGYTVILGNDASLTTVTSLLTSGLSLGAQRMIHVQIGRVSTAALETAWVKVNTSVAGLLTGRGAYWLDVDPTLQQIVVGVDESLTSTATGDAIAAIAPGLVHVLYEGSGDRAVRSYGDAAPHFGGAIISPEDAPYPQSWCTAGFTVRRVSDNTRASVTAGHCGTPGSNGGTWNSRSYFYGVKRGTHDYPDYDQARLEDSRYNPYIYTDGGDDGQAFRSVRGATDPVIGDRVCQAGVTSESECGIEIGSVTATYCDDPGNPHWLHNFPGERPPRR